MLLRNTCYMMASTLVRLLTGVVLFVIFARVWGVERFGSFMYPYAVTGLAAIVVDYGYTLQLVRDAAKHANRVAQLVQEAIFVKLLMTVLVVVAMIVWTLVTHPSSSLSVLLWALLVAAIANSFGLLLNLPFRAIGRFEEETRIVFWSNVVLFVLSAGMCLLGYGPVVISVTFAIARIVYLVLSWRHFTELAGDAPLEWPGLKKVLIYAKTGFPFGLHVALGTLYFQVDSLLIQHYMGAKGVGMYQAGTRIMMGGLIFADVLSNVYLPPLATAAGSPKDLVRISKRMTRHLFAIGAIGTACMILFAQYGVKLTYGSSYTAASRVIILMSVVFFLRYVGGSYGALLTVADRQDIRAIGVSVALVANLILNYVMIPRWGLDGAVVASIITHVILNAIYCGFGWCQVRSLLLEKRSIALLLTVGAAYALLLVSFSVPTVVKVAATVVVILSMCVLGCSRSEWKRITSKLQGLKAGALSIIH